MACNNCNRRKKSNMQTTQINQKNQNPYAELIKSIAIRSNKACQQCGYKLNISDTLAQHNAFGEAFEELIRMLSVEFQLNQNEKERLLQQSTGWIRYSDVVWDISKIMDDRPFNLKNIQPQQQNNRTTVQQQQIQQPRNQVIKQQPQQSVVVQPPQPIMNSSSTKILQEKTNDLFKRITEQNRQRLEESNKNH